jgi:TetR/AcrR family transcriptional regulator
MSVTATGSSSRILQTALALFSTKGYDATSVREICEAAGITKPTLYHFFGSKEGVYSALVEGALDDFQRTIERAVEPSGTAVERLKRVARGYFDSAMRQRELVRLILALVHNPSSGAPATDFPKFYERIVQLVAGVVDDGVRARELGGGPVEARMLVFMGTLGEAVCGNLIVGRPWLSEELADTLVETIVGGWRNTGGTR